MAKPNKFRKIDSYSKNVSSIELNRQMSLEESFLNLSIDYHEKNVNSQEVRAVMGKDCLEWPEIGMSWSKSNEIIHSTPMRPQIILDLRIIKLIYWLKDMMFNAKLLTLHQEGS